MTESLSLAVRDLWNPEYQHVVLLPFLVHGLLLCGLFALGATVLKQSRAAALALLMVALCALAAIPFLQAREAALPALQAAHSKYDSSEIAAVGQRLNSVIWLYYGVAGISIIALLASLTKASLGMIFGILASLIAIGTGFWGLDMHHRETVIYHPNLGKPPKTLPAIPVNMPGKPAQPSRVLPAPQANQAPPSPPKPAPKPAKPAAP